MGREHLPAYPPRLEFRSLSEALLHWAERQPDQPAAILLARGEEETARLTYGELAAAATAIAADLAAQGLAGHRLLLPAQTSLEFLKGFYGAMMAGAIVVPVATMLRGAAADRLRAVVANCDAAGVLNAPGAQAVQQVLPDARLIDLTTAKGERRLPEPPDGTRAVLLQYTSGSTATPRGVTISGDNLAKNAEMLRHGFRVRPDSRMLGWLPLYHDMGLLCSMVMPLWSGITTVLMPPLSFLQRPQRWPIAVHRHGATISGGPNFAFDLCAARAEGVPTSGIDLSRWEVVFCGSEPVRRASLRAFADVFRPAGLDARSIYPCYGLAEATVFVSGGHWNPDADDGPVSCGRIANGSTVTIGAVDSGEPVGPGEAGEILVAGPHVGIGYWNDPTATAETFVTRGETRWLRTGDVGTLKDDQVYVLGRLKDVLIHRGSNIHACDLEATAHASHPALSDARAAAFAVEQSDREDVVLVLELARRSVRLPDLAPVVRAVEDAVAVDHSLKLHELLMVRPGALPRTASGKVRRAEARRLYMEGAFHQHRLGSETAEHSA